MDLSKIMKTQKNKLSRPQCQRKQGKKQHKSMRGVAELYDEKKRQFNTTLTPTAITNLEKIALEIKVSRSEVIEKAARGEIDLLEILKLVNLT